MDHNHKYTNKHKKQLFSKITSLSKTEHEEIYKIIIEHETKDSIAFSKNRNGVFFNLSDVDDNLYDKIDKFVDYCINNTKNLDEYDKKINECKINNNYTNIIHINLDNMPNEDIENIKDGEDWNAILIDSKSIQKVSTYVEKLMSDRDKVGKKKMNVKFSNAKKKYAKKITPESKKIDNDLSQDLQTELYIQTI